MDGYTLGFIYGALSIIAIWIMKEVFVYVSKLKKTIKELEGDYDEVEKNQEEACCS